METDGITIKVSGIDQATADLKALPRRLRKQVLVRSLRLAATPMHKAARAYAPRKTGRLRKGVFLRVSKINNGRRRPVQGVYISLRKGEGREDPKDAFYGRFIEEGWEVRGKKKAKRTGKTRGRKSESTGKHVRGRKFMERAFKQHRRGSVRIFQRAMARGLVTVKKQLGMLK